MLSPKPDIRIVENVEKLSWEAAELFVRQAREAVRTRGGFTVALAGGSTPKAFYELLGSRRGTSFRARVPWGTTHFFWGDERHVPPDHPDSNYRVANEAMLSRVPVAPQNVHRIQAENPDASMAAEDYDQELRGFFRLPSGHFPRFDLILLGMGPDGHTASLFPGTDVIQEQKKLVVAPWVETIRTHRITLTPPVLNNAASVIFLVSGKEKAETLREVLQGEYQPHRFPAQIIRPKNGRLLWLVERAAGRLLR
ncbi:MAG: 6-phosphogluconolactonase [Candidatus Methylomirabilota bacterium]